MGYMCHHAIVVTSWNRELLETAHEEASEIFKWVSPLSPLVTNSISSFFVPPDGSKEGWDESEKGNEDRDRFIAWLDSRRYSDNSSALKWVEVQYGDEEGEDLVTRKDSDTEIIDK